MRFTGLAELKRPEVYEIVLGPLPRDILMARYAMAKAFKINELVLEIHQGSYEWYGYTIARREAPELIVDIGLPENDQNVADYTSVAPEAIAEYQESLSRGRVINGWIHSHGALEYEGFSDTDENNQATVLDYVTALLRKPVAKRALVIKDLVLLVKGESTERELAKGSVSLITDAPIGEAMILETIYGGFCYSIVIGDGGWHRQEIHYKRRGILSGRTVESKTQAAIVLVETGRALTEADVAEMVAQVRERIRPVRSVPRERFEREAT